MEKRIDLEKRGKRPNQIVDLNLDNCRSTNIVGLTDEFTALETLSLINVGLTTLKGFPTLPSLRKLELSDNRISSGLNYLTNSSKLTHLNLSGNKIKDLETLKPLESFKNLAVLDLFNNEATQMANYRETIFAMLPSLKYLDGFDSNDVEAPSEGDDEDDVNGNDSDSDVSDELGEDEDGDDVSDDDDDVEDSDEEEANGDVSLAEVYNDNLEEDNSDWNEDEHNSEDDDEISNDEEEESGNGNANVAEKESSENQEDESQARGKKRKHDG